MSPCRAYIRASIVRLIKSLFTSGAGTVGGGSSPPIAFSGIATSGPGLIRAITISIVIIWLVFIGLTSAASSNDLGQTVISVTILIVACWPIVLNRARGRD